MYYKLQRFFCKLLTFQQTLFFVIQNGKCTEKNVFGYWPISWYFLLIDYLFTLKCLLYFYSILTFQSFLSWFLIKTLLDSECYDSNILSKVESKQKEERICACTAGSINITIVCINSIWSRSNDFNGI